MCRYCWAPPISRDDRDYMYPREDDYYAIREESWEATPTYDTLIAREGGDDEMAEAGEEDREYGQVWLVEEGLRPVPNREHA